MAVVTKAVGGGTVTEGTLLSLLTYVHRCDRETAAAMIDTALERGVIEAVRPGVYRVADGHRRRLSLTQ